MIGTGRRINDFDNFMNPNQFVSPRQAPLSNVQNYYSNQDRHHSPNRINNTRKPMISPVRSPRPQSQLPKVDKNDKFCSNQIHPQKKADYYIRIEGEDMYYCEKCATQAASQGFTVKRIQSMISNPQSKKGRVIPQYPQYIGHKRYHEISELLKNIISLENDFKSIDLNKVGDHYQKQEDMLNCFYDQLVGLVQRMRGDHLNDLQIESQKNQQAETFRVDHLRTHMQEISQVWNDIEDNVEEIVEKVDQENYEKCMKTYGNSLQLLSLKMEEFQEEQDKYTTYAQSDLSNKVRHFEQQLIDLWQDGDGQTTLKIIPEKKSLQLHSDRTTIRTVHDMLPHEQPNKFNGQGQGAFRNLFPEEEGEERMPEASPQFKAF